EPFGYAPLEASSCGTPVVGVPEGGIRETVKDGINGFLSESNDSIDIANKIKKILEMNEMEYKNISVSSRKYIEEFYHILHI
ncbi:MAG: glycosyltransferase, partial [Spirochaetia bacterium]|nr:glycosyltransferase [Spirochaetia bacterium]